MSGKLWALVRREYLARVRTKGFVIGTILGPLLMGALMVLPMLAAKAGDTQLRVVVLDSSGQLQAQVEQALRGARFGDKRRFAVPAGDTGFAVEGEAALKKAVLARQIDGYLHLPQDAVASAKATYYGRNVSNRLDLGLLQSAVGEVLVSRRLAGVGIDPGRVRDLTKGLDLKTVQLSETGEREDRGLAMIFAIILLTILYSAILMWGQIVMTGVIEEKTSRVVEVMASGVPSTHLLWGKLLGVGGAGLTQFLVWAASLSVVSAAGGGLALGGLRLPAVTPLVLVSFVAFFLLGFLFYATLYAAIGAAVNNVQEAQTLVLPAILPMVAGFMFFLSVLESPDSTLSVVLSLLPFLAPLLMFLRIVVLTPPLWQIGLSLVLLALSIAGLVWVAARIYRVGILMYGKKPTFPELLRWVRHG
jgi:ABC-2 type transport system permease protein